jgi:hypothetical protein
MTDADLCQALGLPEPLPLLIYVERRMSGEDLLAVVGALAERGYAVEHQWSPEDHGHFRLWAHTRHRSGNVDHDIR